MFPILQIGPLALQVPGMLLLIGAYIRLRLTERITIRRGKNADPLYNLIFLVVAAGLIGARLSFTVRNFGLFRSTLLNVFSLDPGLLDPWGGVIAGLIAALVYGRRKQMAFLSTLDAFTPAFAAGRFSSTNMNYPEQASPARALPLPPVVGGGSFRGADATWRTCPFDYRAEAGAVDENGKIDGTPTSLVFHVSGAPQLGSLAIPKVLVFVPTCPAIFPCHLSVEFADAADLRELPQHHGGERGSGRVRVAREEVAAGGERAAHDGGGSVGQFPLRQWAPWVRLG